MDGRGRSDWKFAAFVKLLEFWKVMVLILAEQWLIYTNFYLNKLQTLIFHSEKPL